MSFSYKNKITINIFGASHSKQMGISLDGVLPGIKLDKDLIVKDIKRRQPLKDISTSRKEADEFEIVSGVFNGYTNGDNICVIVQNNNTISKHYNNEVMRPGHADYPSYVKSNGFHDFNGGGKFSGRMSVLIVIIGAIAKQILKSKYEIEIFSHINNIGTDFDDKLSNQTDFKELQNQTMPMLNLEQKEKIINSIKVLKKQGDSVGGSVNVFAKNLKVGIGEPFFDSVESVFAHLMFSIGAVKGVNFGEFNDFNTKLGSQVKDEMVLDANGEITFCSNNNGGINGGLTNGNLIKANVLFKPTPTIMMQQKTFNIKNKENVTLNNIGRHDPCIVVRASVICEAVMALTLLDLTS